MQGSFIRDGRRRAQRRHIDCVIAYILAMNFLVMTHYTASKIRGEGNTVGRGGRQVMPCLLASGNTCARLSNLHGFVSTVVVGHLRKKRKF